MTVGDVLEWVALCAFTAAAALSFGLVGGLVVAGVGLAYEGQCYPSPVRLPKLRRVARPAGTPWLPTGAPQPMFSCAVCGESTPQGSLHRCVDVA